MFSKCLFASNTLILKVLVALSESISGSGNKNRRAGESSHRQSIPQVFFSGAN